MDFDMANQYAKQILEGKDDQYQELVKMCLPYLYYLRKKMGFYRISLKEVKNELAAGAVSDAIMAQRERKLPFSICIHNEFRDICRARNRIIREHDTNNIVSQCDIEEPRKVMCVGTRHPSPQVKARDNELVELANNILKNHNRFSKQVVYQKTRGSTYPEMAGIFSTTLNECKRVYRHDINHIREKLNPNPKEE
ncbi:MAG: hypothetical protein FVQ84_20690 [Planctomycetes bacterium]|nr:hypothetical protein [Planctomycetota bacterium]